MARSPIIPVIKELARLLELLLQTEYTSNYLPYELTEEGIKRRRKSSNRKIREWGIENCARRSGQLNTLDLI